MSRLLTYIELLWMIINFGSRYHLSILLVVLEWKMLVVIELLWCSTSFCFGVKCAFGVKYGSPGVKSCFALVSCVHQLVSFGANYTSASVIWCQVYISWCHLVPSMHQLVSFGVKYASAGVIWCQVCISWCQILFCFGVKCASPVEFAYIVSTKA